MLIVTMTTGRVDYFMRNATLKIVDVRLEDEGKYGCVVLPINEDSTMLDEDMKNPPTTWTKLVVNGKSVSKYYFEIFH